MLIECKIRRENGTRVELNGRVYHFLPVATGEHVCEIGDHDVVERLLQIPEAYRPARPGVESPAGAPDPAPVAAPPRQPQRSVKTFIPEGAPTHIRDMTREQLFQYAANLGMRKPHPTIATGKLRANIQMFLAERDEMVRGEETAEATEDAGTVFTDPAGRDPHDDDSAFAGSDA